MRRGKLFLFFIFFTIGCTGFFFRELPPVQKSATQRIHVRDDDQHQEPFKHAFRDSHLPNNDYERSVPSYRITSHHRQLPFSFHIKEVATSHFIKNKEEHVNLLYTLFQSKKDERDYYTLGLQRLLF